MSDSTSPFAMLPRENPEEEAAREERHQLLATLLGAFADGELPAETASQVDAHLLGCTRCRHELQVHRVLRLRLEQEPLPVATAALRDRIGAAISAAPPPQWEALAHRSEAAVATRKRRVLVPVLLIGLLAVGAFAMVQWWNGRTTAASLSLVTPTAQPLIRDAIEDYRRVTAGDLPGRARDLATVRAAMPFPVQPLSNPELRLLATWTTTLGNEPAAVLAYRWNDQVVLQYIVSDQQLYRSAGLRAALVGGKILGTEDGSLRGVGWADRASASLVLGNISFDKLTALRELPRSR